MKSEVQAFEDGVRDHLPLGWHVRSLGMRTDTYVLTLTKGAATWEGKAERDPGLSLARSHRERCARAYAEGAKLAVRAGR